jgi:hypothetical protein
MRLVRPRRLLREVAREEGAVGRNVIAMMKYENGFLVRTVWALHSGVAWLALGYHLKRKGIP